MSAPGPIPVAVDLETWLIRPGLLCPPLVCLSFAENNTSDVVSRTDALGIAGYYLRRDDVLIVGANIAFDTACLANEFPSLLPLIFEKYDKGLVSDVQIREMLLDIQAGDWRTKTDAEGKVSRTGYSLADLAKTRLGVEMDKTTWRTGYAKLRDIPLSEWPQGAIDYAKGDAKITLKIWQDQEATCCCHPFMEPPGHKNGECNLSGEAGQVRAAFALHLMSCWGMRTDPETVRSFKAGLVAKDMSFKAVLTAAGVYRPNGTKDVTAVRARLKAAEDRDFAIGAEQEMAAIAYSQSGKNPGEWEGHPADGRVPFVTERTPTGQVKIDADSLKRSGDPVLETLAEAGGVQKLLTTYVPVLERGTEHPIQARYHVLARSGRTSCASPNIQNLPREPGVREAFCARDGFVFIDCDYSILELRCLAQVLLQVVGWSKMAEALQAGRELHLALAAQIIGIEYDEAVSRKGDREIKEARQLAKVGNFGFPGGMGPDKLVDFARAAYGLRLTVAQCNELRSNWFKAFPEMREYFQWVSKEIGRAGSNRLGSITQLSGRVRGGVGFCDAANCVDYETEALTDRGWLRGDAITMSDRLLTKNAATGKLEWQRPNAIKQYPEYSGELIEFSSKAFSAVTTPSHRWLVDRKSGAKAVCVTSEKLSKHGDDKIHRTGVYEVAETEQDWFVQLAGWFLTDGCIKRGKRNAVGVNLMQSMRANPHKVAEIDSLLAASGAPFSRALRGPHGLVVWNIKKGVVRDRLLRLFPKRIATVSFLSTLSRRQARILVQTMVRGDGNVSADGQTKFCAGTKEKADAFQTLCAIAGLSSKAEWRDMSGYSPVSSLMPNVPKMTGCWSIAVLKRERAQVTEKQTRRFIEARGVWCPSVDNTYFVARRKGCVYITGNTMFQGLAADGAKAACWEVAKKCYYDKGSDLYGSRPVAFIHDELILEAPEAKAHEALKDLEETMKATMQKFTPDIPQEVSGHISRVWSKAAERVEVNGRVVPWEQ